MDEPHELDRLREQAQRCRRLASDVSDRRTMQALTELALDYDRQAEELERHLRAPISEADSAVG
jgi:hypothetical protein